MPAVSDWQQALARRFPELAPASLAALVAQARSEPLDAHQTLLAAGSAWQHAFWVERGLLRLFYIDSEGRESNKNFHAEDAFIWPVTEMMRREPAAFFIAALTPATVWRLPYGALQASVGALPSWTALQLHALAGLLDDKMRREQVFLQCTARQRYEALLRERPEWTGRIPLRHLASYLGMTDVSLSRLRAEMGLIDG
ncbi:cAMP-binding domain of CRP or a regulatory subunit of cAMP-dependent protein kinases [Variovorax sp. YR266]|uniref:Crp/Fnr family transcriptional regulator n=1 Tax=Variovorax sp. YR266 TaxID=1884386 RepID=UPI00089653AC|nr:Crp/Fnr family transcriptional regulator [Variovorax sp. YR266]SDZ65129.1 cAMP-binding domain of CRP or a regulatory subunit of cAMP-dependent protein kinases [Variovorax sp. YR266]